MPETKAKEYPIIFNEWSINRILAGEKSQTRRIVKSLPDNVEYVEQLAGSSEWVCHVGNATHKIGDCPYGQPGDSLWVREAFRLPAGYDEMGPADVIREMGCEVWRYEADGEEHGPKWKYPNEKTFTWGKYRHNRYMPRELCRLRLRVEDVRVERIQDISQSDARAEGVTKTVVDSRGVAWNSDRIGRDGTYRMGFKLLWNDIHGDGAWEENSWVWVIEFSRIDE